jgi:hypothetical protein
MTQIFPSEGIQQIQSSYDQVKDKFREPLCQKCGTHRTQFSWSRLDIASMARKASKDLGKLYLQCYLEPTLQAHATVSSLIARLRERDGGGVSFSEEAQHGKASEALIGAHNVILHVIRTQNEYFKLNLDQEIGERFKNFMAVWDES